MVIMKHPKENGESYFGEVKLGVVLKEGKDFKEVK